LSPAVRPYRPGVPPSEESRAYRLLLLVGGLPWLVFLALAAFAYPATDDWTFRALALARGVVPGTLDHLAHWGGRFAVIPLDLALHRLPAPNLAFVAAIALNLLLLPLSLHRLLPAATPARTATAISLASLVVCTLPSPAQGLYWLCGMLAYVFPLHLVAAALALVHAPANGANGRVPAWRVPAILALGLFIPGFGETVAVLVGGSAAILALAGRWRAWWLAAGIAGGLAASTAMPGTWARLAVAHEHGGMPLGAVLQATAAAPIHFLAVLIGQPACLASLIIAARLGATTPAVPDRVPARAWVVVLVPGVLAAALLPSYAALGLIEGRQADAVWLALLLWSLAASWWLGAARPRWFAVQATAPAVPPCGLQLGAFLVLAATILALIAAPTLPAVILGAFALLLTAAAALALRRGERPLWLPAVLLATLAATGSLHTALADLVVNAPVRRAEQAARDEAVGSLARSGVADVRFPLADPGHFPATISMGDLLGAGTWPARSYAECFGLHSAGADPHLRATIATDAAGHALAPIGGRDSSPAKAPSIAP
jgi:hypothetical protein